YLIKISPDADKRPAVIDRRYRFIWCDDTRRSTDRLSSSCFVLHRTGFFLPRELLRAAVSSYLAFSPLPALFSKNRRYHFCDTFRRRNLTNATPAFFTRHVAVWCSDFPLASLTTHQRSSAITHNLPRSAPKERKPRICVDRPSPGAEAGTRGPMSSPIDTCSIRVRSVLFLFLIWSVYGFKPMGEKELFLCRQKCFRRSNDRAQRRRHLKTDQDKDEAPDSEMTFA